MTLFPVAPEHLESFTIVTYPVRTFSSSSTGVTGSVFISARRSAAEKESRPSPAFIDTTLRDGNPEDLLLTIQRRAGSTLNIAGDIAGYFNAVRSAGISRRNLVALPITRIVPSFNFTSDTIRKTLMKTTLMPFYRSYSPTYNWAFTNYHSLNFFTASSVSPSTAIMYPTPTGAYSPKGAFTFDFYINPRYAEDQPNTTMKAGTILHLSGTYALSLLPGSSRDIYGYTDRFRLKLQLSHSADLLPSVATGGLFPSDLVFLSADNSLTRNSWHHVIVSWGGPTVNGGTGSFYVDSKLAGNFAVPFSTISPAIPTKVLTIGNFYEGNQEQGAITRFFASEPSRRDGLIELDSESGYSEPNQYAFNHPLNAELHDVSLWSRHTSFQRVVEQGNSAPQSLSGALLYVPPFFTEASPFRRLVGANGGVLQTPFATMDGSTRDAFNVSLSFGVAARYTNLENFGLDLATRTYPKFHALSASEIVTSTGALSANDFLYANPAVRKRNLTILPCDDGNFYPNFSLLPQSVKYVDDLQNLDKSLITLDNLIPSGNLDVIALDGGTIATSVNGASPENYNLAPGKSALTIYQRTQDPSSNEVVFFNVSNIFYGKRILPGSVNITDANLTGSNRRVTMQLKDDGNGNLYRASGATTHAQWASVGNVFYNEGLILVKSPMIPFFGKNGFDVTFKGEQNIHTFKVTAIAGSNELNVSTNPSFLPLSASFDPNVEDNGFVYITNVNYHDENLNVVMRTQLAQPIVKINGSRIAIRSRLDF